MPPAVSSGNLLLAALPRDCMLALQADLKEISLPLGEVLMEPGDAVGKIYFPHSGMISLVVVMKEGTNVEASTVGREGAVGLTAALGERRANSRAIVQAPGLFAVVRAARFEQVVRGHSGAIDLIARYLEAQWAESQQLVACNAVHDAASRLCRWMLQCSDRIGSNIVPLTQEFLSHMLGVRRTTITLLAQDMQARGLIKYTRGRIVIVDRPGLEAASCECYNVTRQYHAGTLGLHSAPNDDVDV